MNCSNQKCGKSIDQPLELYDGSWACPHCKKQLLNLYGSLRYTAENMELYVLSERYYFDWLTMTAEEQKMDEQKTVLRAVELCKQSARLGNPLATVRLGYYYDKDYVEVNRSESVRCQIAYAYYSSVCFAGEEPKQEKGLSGVPDWAQVKQRAGRFLLEMLAFAPEEFVKVDRYNFEKNVNKVASAVGEGVARSVTRTQSSNVVPRSQLAFDTLLTCFSKFRAPLLGVIHLSAQQLRRLFTLKNEKMDVYRMIEKGLRLKLVDCKADGSVDRSENFYSLTNRRQINAILESITAENVCLYFFNPNGKHRFLGASERKNIASILEGDSHERIYRLLNDAGRIDYTFFDDDIYYHKLKLRPLKWTVNEFIKRVCGGENE